MNILAVAGWTYPDQEGGSFRLVYEVARRHAARGHTVHVITQRLEATHPEHEDIEGVHVHRYPTGGGAGVSWRLAIRREVPRLIEALQRERAFDAVLMHHLVPAHAALRAPGIRALPIVQMAYVPYSLEYLDRRTYEPSTGGTRRPGLGHRLVAAYLRFVERRTLRAADRIAVLSAYSRDLIAKWYPPFAGKVVQFPGGADLERFRPEPSRPEARRRLGLDGLGLPDGSPLFFTCRRLEHRMGVLELVEAIAQLRARRRDAVLLVAGRGNLEAALQQQVERLGLGEAVRLLGYVPEEDLLLWYRAADCTVVPTRALEGFGLVTAEAMACGTPVIGTPGGATPELLRPFDARLVAEDATPEALGEAIHRFLDEISGDPELEARCRAYAEKYFSWDRLADGILKAFETVQKQTRGAAP
jgi:glycosyltransferase involved in cell wall biosynthesis